MSKIIFLLAGYIVVPSSVIAMEAPYALHEAAQRGDINQVRRLLDDGADVNKVDEKTRTPLHLAAQRGNTDVMRLLLERGAEVNSQDCVQWTPLHIAAMSRHNDAIQVLIAAGANINQKTSRGFSPFHHAILGGDFATIQTLIAAGADIEFDHGIKIACYDIARALTDCKLRIQNARQRARDRIIGNTLALATHGRLSAHSPLALLPQELLHDISRWTVDAECDEARLLDPLQPDPTVICPICLKYDKELATAERGQTPCCQHFICQSDLARMRMSGSGCRVCFKRYAMKELVERRRIIARTIAMATHPRLGGHDAGTNASPMALLPQNLLRELAQFATEYL